MHSLGNLLVLCNRQLNVWNDLAKAKRRRVSKRSGGWIRATTFEGTLQGGLEGSLPGGGGHEGEKGWKPP